MQCLGRAAQRQHQAVGAGVFRQAQEIGDQAGTGQAIGFERVFEVLDQILALAVRQLAW